MRESCVEKAKVSEMLRSGLQRSLFNDTSKVRLG